MTETLATLPIAPLAALIFCLRIGDVSLGTIRTIAVVEGRVNLAVLLGFFEVLIWITAVSQVIQRVDESPVLLLAYAAGFASGNAVGILLERWLAMGSTVVRFISNERGEELARDLRAHGWMVTTFAAQGGEGERLLLYAIVPRRDTAALLGRARIVDPGVFYVVERVSELGHVGGAARSGRNFLLARKRV